ncbi:NAD(P)H:quinone oxidoreductase [Sulfitobacter sp. D35]|uniref:NAD(P)H:quinone oxidoreductase n=1 Tax=Sulfitobacter sp. D35 TaxID=3083252 RepID=UPI00296EBA7E|nr:NAD(P)H:quinone oxidoreductase [Sulfitobacter sp. D35]MDW4498254.1 NAD(P)H:quinone oxidoreductase [Sulfitobacter sp. D35]
MSTVKLTIVFYSSTGTNLEMARAAQSAAEEAGAEVRLRRCAETAPDEAVNSRDAWKSTLERMQEIDIAAPEDLEWADALLFSAPTRFAAVPSQMQAFIDTLGPLWNKGALAGKAVSAMTSTGTRHGGQETTLIGFYTTFMHWGAILVPPGYTGEIMFEHGNPYGASAMANDVDDTLRSVVEHQTRRLLDVAGKLSA